MPILAVGTTNPGKVEAVKTALSQYGKCADWKIEPSKVASGVSDQPMTMEETTRGAKNRAAAAMAAVEGASLGIGMESGLFKSDDKLFDVCACAIFDGEKSHIGYSCAWELPGSVTDLVLNKGKNLTEAFNECEICDDPNIGDKGGVIAIMTGNRITRPMYTVQSIQMALAALNPQYYPCAKSVPSGINDIVEKCCIM
eukprot:gnl/MRDRNA2_/MRDRNA2_27499_c0_seq1.p1 gnl/MRDRNA2_/MRDRNA2_27499_c0~~gnl/MRDRNA2_/MRDRNA2_27499_c0_seq1.p1  ORF type:complete len:198 (-),score=33.93 gnl/MRDRNA2_/MRDRNA2_27499_c0_seq1:162-755(-)